MTLTKQAIKLLARMEIGDVMEAMIDGHSAFIEKVESVHECNFEIPDVGKFLINFYCPSVKYTIKEDGTIKVSVY